MKRICPSCGELAPFEEMQLEAGGFRVCAKCYLADPPRLDIDGVLAQVAARAARDYALEQERDHSRIIESVCDCCGGRASNGGCNHGCR